MKYPKRQNRRFRFLGAALALSLFISGGQAKALNITAVTSDNGYPAHQVQWTDNAGLPRTAVMVDQNSKSGGPYTGYLRRYTYVVNGQTRTCTGTTNYATGGDLETSGDGFVQNHTADGGDYSTGNGVGTPGTTTITLQGSSHALITYNISTYQINGQTVPTTIQWFFADGRANPIFSITQDSRSTTKDLGADSRSPYGDMAYDGDGVDAEVGGYSYGDTYKFVTLASNPEQVSNLSPWKDTEANTIPYAMQWAQPTTVDAEMGHVATAPISFIDQGQDTETSQYDNPPDLFDPRTQSSAGPLPPANTQAFQIINYSLVGNSTTDSKRLTWGANFGRVGGFDNYGDTSLNISQYSQHSNDPINSPLDGTRADGLLMAYSVFIVFGPHGGSYPAKAYETGTVGQMVTQMENAAVATLSATTGTVVTSGPKGVGNASSTALTYSPAGYNPVYSTWEITAASNAANATLTPAAAKSLDHPVLVVDGYTSAQLPGSISVGNGLSKAGVDYFATLDTANQRLWITVNRLVSSPANLIVQTAAPAITSASNTTFTVGQAGSFTVTATGSPAPTFSATGLPSWVSLNATSGVLSGMPPSTSGAPFTLSLTAANGVLPNATQSFTLNVALNAQTINFPAITSQTFGTPPLTLNATASSGLPVTFSVFSGPATINSSTLSFTGTGQVTVMATQAGDATYSAAPAVEQTFTVNAASPFTFSQWTALYSISGGAAATPENDGICNLLKYLYDINPAQPVNASTRLILPVPGIDTTTNPGTKYLTLTYRQYAAETGLTINVQTTADLQTWKTVVPNITQQVRIDQNTGDPIMELEVNVNGSTEAFIRLNVTLP